MAGLDETSVRPVIVAGSEAVSARAQADKWQFSITVLRLNGKVFRFLTAAPVGSASLDTVANSVTGSFRLLTSEERASVKPARMRIVTVKAGETAGSLANRMSGVDRKLDLFRILNGLTAGQSVSAGDKVKLVVTE